ncbi:MAG: hypothetical protein WC436_00900 [Candidatus Babeliales bacterium]
MDKKVFLAFFLSFFFGLIYCTQEEENLQDSETENNQQEASTQTDEIFFMGVHEQFLLGIKYLNFGDNKEALKFFELAAQRHHLRAQFMAATILYNGGNCSSDDLMMAFKYCRLAAIRDHVPAKKLLEKMQIDLVEYLLKENKKPISINIDELLESMGINKEEKEDRPIPPGIYM